MTYCFHLCYGGFNSSIKELRAWLFRLGIKLLRCSCALMFACQVMWHERFKKNHGNFPEKGRKTLIRRRMIITVTFRFQEAV